MALKALTVSVTRPEAINLALLVLGPAESCDAWGDPPDASVGDIGGEHGVSGESCPHIESMVESCARVLVY